MADWDDEDFAETFTAAPEAKKSAWDDDDDDDSNAVVIAAPAAAGAAATASAQASSKKASSAAKSATASAASASSGKAAAAGEAGSSKLEASIQAREAEERARAYYRQQKLAAEKLDKAHEDAGMERVRQRKLAEASDREAAEDLFGVSQTPSELPEHVLREQAAAASAASSASGAVGKPRRSDVAGMLAELEQRDDMIVLKNIKKRPTLEKEFSKLGDEIGTVLKPVCKHLKFPRLFRAMLLKLAEDMDSKALKEIVTVAAQVQNEKAQKEATAFREKKKGVDEIKEQVQEAMDAFRMGDDAVYGNDYDNDDDGEFM